MGITRRDLITNGFLASLAYSIPKVTFANINQGGLDNFFVQILAPGGMDVTLSLDPLNHNIYGTDNEDIFLEYRWDQIVKYGDLILGPACQSLKPYMKNIATINGIVMRRDVGHDSLLAYMASGSGSGDLPYFAIEANHFLPTTTLGTLVNTSFRLGDRRPSLSQIRDHEHSTSSSVLNPESIDILKDIYEKTGSSLTKPNLDMLKFNSQKEGFYKKIEDITQLIEQESKEAPIIAAAFIQNVANSAIINLEDIQNLEFDFDTHSDHEGRHLEAQMGAWYYVSQIFDLFSKIPYRTGTLFDHTTFVVVSEFSRTPYLNAAKGKDHNVYTNSVLLAGGKINGARSFGGSKVIPRSKRKDGRAIHIGSPFDYSTGKSVNASGDGIELIFPENVAKTLAQLFKNESVYPGLNSIKQIPGLFK